jgi:hypothetical protein
VNVDGDLRTLLQDRADEVQVDPRIPAAVLRRARRRRVATGVVAGAVAVGAAAGMVVGARVLLQVTTGPRQVRPAASPSGFYPFIYPSTAEELATTEAEVAQGSMPMWTEPRGAAILFAVNVMGWDMDAVEAEVGGDTATIRNPSLPEAARFEGGLPTTLHLLEVPGSDPPIYAVLAAVADAIGVEPVGPDDTFGSGGRVAFRGRLAFVPTDPRVIMTVEDDQGVVEAVTIPDAEGRFTIAAPRPIGVGSSTLISIALEDGSGRTLAMTSSRIATPVVGGTETGTSEPQLAIPGPVAGTRDAILDAAQARDFEALRALIPDRGFTFSYGGETDPIRYWKRLESEGHEPVIGDILPMVLNTEPGFDRGVFVWPAQAAEDPQQWDEHDLEVLRQIHAEEDIRLFREIDLYTGWRIGIDRDGTWVFFVSGD